MYKFNAKAHIVVDRSSDVEFKCDVCIRPAEFPSHTKITDVWDYYRESLAENESLKSISISPVTI